MSSLTTEVRLSAFAGEVGKLSAFLRRDLLVAWSYRLAFVSDWLGLLLQALMLYFVGRLVDPTRLPSFGGSRVTYMEFVAVGIAIGSFMQLALSRVATGFRNEQMAGTLESLLMTPTATTTIQIGTVVYDLIYVPIRTGLFLFVVALTLGLHFDANGLLPAAVVLIAFIPFVWGIGILSAAGVITFRRGSSVASLVVVALTFGSGAYFPLGLFPHWVARLARLNPVAVAVHGMRVPLLGGAGWAGAVGDILELVPMSAVSLLLGILAFRAALRRERRRGSLGLY